MGSARCGAVLDMRDFARCVMREGIGAAAAGGGGDGVVRNSRGIGIGTRLGLGRWNKPLDQGLKPQSVKDAKAILKCV